MNDRERPQDPAEGPDDPNVYEPEPGQPGDDDQADIGVDDLAEAMPGAGRMNESTEDPGTSDPDLRPDRQAPLP